MSVVADSSVLLAITYGEPGADRALEVIEGARVSAVNLSEVVAKFIKQGSTVEDATASVAEFGVMVVPFDLAQAVDAGLLRRATRDRGLSLGDRACLALARREGATVLTADRAWAGLDVGVPVEVIR